VAEEIWSNSRPGVHGEKAPSQALPYPGYWTSGIRLPERLNLQLS
jgi:hypothetical protein